MKNDGTYLSHILEAIEKIESYIAGADYEQFASNNMMIDDIVRELEIIGEASTNLTKEFREEHANVQWQQMIGMRNFVIHEYFGVNTEIVWDTCKNNLAVLKPLIKQALAEFD